MLICSSLQVWRFEYDLKRSDGVAVHAQRRRENGMKAVAFLGLGKNQIGTQVDFLEITGVIAFEDQFPE